MGVVVRPEAFARAAAPAASIGAPESPRSWPGQRWPIRRWWNSRIVAILVALFALAWILAFAGAVFAFRVFFVLCLAMLAGATRHRDLIPRRRAS